MLVLQQQDQIEDIVVDIFLEYRKILTNFWSMRRFGNVKCPELLGLIMDIEIHGSSIGRHLSEIRETGCIRLKLMRGFCLKRRRILKTRVPTSYFQNLFSIYSPVGIAEATYMVNDRVVSAEHCHYLNGVFSKEEMEMTLSLLLKFCSL